MYSDDSGQWVITYYRYFTVITNKDSYIKHFFYQYSIEPLESAHDGHHLVLSVTLHGGILMT